jgi:apolipoprotein N-acyltransferase
VNYELCLDAKVMDHSLNFVRLQLESLSLVSAAFLAFLLGALSGSAMPPFDFWWIFGFTFPALLFFIHKTSLPRAFLLGWLFGFGYFLVALHWIGYAFFVNAGADLWMMPFAVGGLAAFLAIYWGLASVLTLYFVARGFEPFLLAPIFFTAAEYLRGHLFSGFAWAAPGLAVDGMGGVSQLTYIIGMEGLTFLVLLWAGALFALMRGKRVLPLLVLAILPLSWVLGEWRLAQNPTQFSETIFVRIVQPNLSEDDAWRSKNARPIFERLLALSAQPPQLASQVTHIVWPESVVPFLIDESPTALSQVGEMLGLNRILMTGAVRRAAPDPQADYFTSVLVIDGTAKVIAHYDKAHLVPGGEFLPLAWLLEPLGFRQVVSLPESFKAGKGPESLRIPGAGLVGAQVCYEATFPQETVDPRNRPDWLVNVTNDGWFGQSTGPWQHLAQFRLRVIEQGLAGVRSANTGVSAILDPFGRYLIKSPLDVEAVYDGQLPLSLAPGPYAKFGDRILLALLLFGLGVAFIIRKPRPRTT